MMDAIDIKNKILEHISYQSANRLVFESGKKWYHFFHFFRFFYLNFYASNIYKYFD